VERLEVRSIANVALNANMATKRTRPHRREGASTVRTEIERIKGW